MHAQGSSDSGFTLLEVLIVVFILGLVSGIIVMNLPERDGPLRTAALQLERDASLLADRAVITGAPHALDLSRNGYQAAFWQNGEWVTLNFKDQSFPRDVQLQIPREERRNDVYRIIFDPVGVPNEEELRLRHNGISLTLSLAQDQDQRGGR